MPTFSNRAVKSPCYDCERWGRADFPDCADTCRPLEAYRALTGLAPRLYDAVDPVALNDRARSPVEHSVEVLAAREFLAQEKERLALSYDKMGALLDLPGHRIHGIITGYYKSLRPHIAAKINHYREQVQR